MKRESAMLQESIHNLQENSTQQKQVKLSVWLSKDLERLETLLNSASIFPYYCGLIDYCRDPLDLEIAAELFLKISWTVNGVSGKVVLDETLIQRQAIVSAKFYSVLEDTLLACLRKNDEEGWHGLTEIYLKIRKSQTVVDTFVNEYLRPKLRKVRR